MKTTHLALIFFVFASIFANIQCRAIERMDAGTKIVAPLCTFLKVNRKIKYCCATSLICYDSELVCEQNCTN